MSDLTTRFDTDEEVDHNEVYYAHVVEEHREHTSNLQWFVLSPYPDDAADAVLWSGCLNEYPPETVEELWQEYQVLAESTKRSLWVAQ